MPKGFSHKKDDDNYWLDAVRDFWALTGNGFDSTCIEILMDAYDKRKWLISTRRRLIYLTFDVSKRTGFTRKEVRFITRWFEHRKRQYRTIREPLQTPKRESHKFYEPA